MFSEKKVRLMKTFFLSVTEINMYDEVRAWKLLRLQDIIPDRLIYNFKSLTRFHNQPFLSISRSIFKKEKKPMN